jgi:2'-5' RNA ligase
MPDEVRAMLSQHLAPLRLPGKVVPPANWHLTVRFLGQTDQVSYERLVAALHQTDLGGVFTIRLGPLGAFPTAARAGVIWLAIDQGAEALAHLAEVVEDAVEGAGFLPEERPYRAHLTISRLRPHQDVRNLIDRYQAVPFKWPATELIVYRSFGTHYQALDQTELRM